MHPQSVTEEKKRSRLELALTHPQVLLLVMYTYISIYFCSTVCRKLTLWYIRSNYRLVNFSDYTRGLSGDGTHGPTQSN